MKYDNPATFTVSVQIEVTLGAHRSKYRTLHIINSIRNERIVGMTAIAFILNVTTDGARNESNELFEMKKLNYSNWQISFLLFLNLFIYFY